MKEQMDLVVYDRRTGDELDRRGAEPGTDATADFRCDLLREWEEAGFDVDVEFEYFDVD